MSLDMPLARDTLTDQLTDRLTQLITVQGLKPGDELPSEGELSARFGVSRAVTREALRSLQERGIVVIANGKRATVRPLTSEPLSNFFRWAVTFERQSLIELLEVRKGLEVQAVMLAVQRRTEDDLVALRETLCRMADALHDARSFTALDATLHRQIAAATQNDMLRHLLSSLHEPLMQQIAASLRSAPAAAPADDAAYPTDHSWLQMLHGEHEQLIDAIARRDATQAVATIAAHLDSARMVIARDPFAAPNADTIPPPL
jgi:GntR family transcriptional repressor for pyruvate dehydrogenase complex